jgi:predicted phosphodiesterase
MMRMMMKMGPVLYCGDCHGQFRQVIQAAGHAKASAVVLLGDMQPDRPLHVELAPLIERGTPLYWIPGNHDADSDELYVRVWGSELKDRNIHGKVVTLPDGATRLAGMGGVWREAVWYPDPAAARGGKSAFYSREDHAKATPRQDRWAGGHHRKHWGTIYEDEYDRLSLMSADVLATHESGSYHPNGFEAVDDLARALGVKVHVHGHQHDALWVGQDNSARWAQQGFASIGVGLRGVTAINIDESGNVVAQVIVPGERDEERARYRKPSP